MELLRAFARAIAAKPYDRDGIEKARKAVLEDTATLGEGAVVEAACNASGMEMTTKVVESTGKKPAKALLGAVGILLCFVRWVAMSFRFLTTGRR